MRQSLARLHPIGYNAPKVPAPTVAPGVYRMHGPQKKTIARDAEKTRPKQRRRPAGKGKPQGEERKPKLSRQHKPEGMSLEDWQIALRRQFGREQPFSLKNLGDEPIFSEFEVTNPVSRNAYR